MKASRARYAIMVLIFEKVVQHIVVTIAFYFNIQDIRSTVAVSPDILMIAGALVGVLFGYSLWGMLKQGRWAIDLVIGLALFDIVGEFVAQGRISIVLTVSFLVAVILLVLSLAYRRHEFG